MQLWKGMDLISSVSLFRSSKSKMISGTQGNRSRSDEKAEVIWYVKISDMLNSTQGSREDAREVLYSR